MNPVKHTPSPLLLAARRMFVSRRYDRTAVETLIGNPELVRRRILLFFVALERLLGQPRRAASSGLDFSPIQAALKQTRSKPP